MTCRFTCGECGRAMILRTDDAPPATGLCVACVYQPGWFRDRDLRDVLAPGHDGRELVDRVLERERGELEACGALFRRPR